MRHCRLRNSNSDVLKDLARWVRRSTKERANGKQSSPRRENYSPGRRKGLHRLAQIRTFAISQREKFSLFTSKFESDMPNERDQKVASLRKFPANSLLSDKNSLLSLQKFPARLRREFWCKPLNLRAEFASKSLAGGEIGKNSLQIPC